MHGALFCCDLRVIEPRIGGFAALLGVSVRLNRPTDLQAIDKKPVDLVFLLLIPADAGSDQLAALATTACFLRGQDTMQRLRTAGSVDIVYRVLTAE